MDQTNPESTGLTDVPTGRLVAVAFLFIAAASGAVLLVWGELDNLLAGRFTLASTLIGLAVGAVFLALLVLWGRFLKSDRRKQ